MKVVKDNFDFILMVVHEGCFLLGEDAVTLDIENIRMAKHLLN